MGETGLEPETIASVNRTRWLLVGVVLLGTGLIFNGLGNSSLDIDEIVQVQVSGLSIPQIIADVVAGRGQPPLYWVLLHFFLPLGRSEFSIRFLSACIGVFNIALVYRWGRSFFGLREGVVAACLLALARLHVRYAQEARMYTAMVCFSLLSLYCLCRAMEANERRQWTGFAVFAVLNLWNHAYAAFVFAAEVALGGLWLLWDLRRTRGDVESARETGSRVRRFLASTAVVVAGWTPVLIAWRRLGERVGLGTGGPLAKLPADAASMVKLGTEFAGGSLTLLVMFGILLLTGLLASMARHRRQILVLVLWMAVPAIGLYALRSERGVFAVRYVIFVLPMLLAFVAKGVVAGSEQAARLLSRWTSRSLGTRAGILSINLALLIVVALGLMSAGPLREWYETRDEDWRGVAAYLLTHLQDGDIILCDGVEDEKGGSAGRSQAGLLYYLNSGHPEELVLREVDVGRKVVVMSETPSEVWGVVYRGTWELKPSSEPGTVVVDFPGASVIRHTRGQAALHENVIAMLETLAQLIPDPASTIDLHFVLAEMHGTWGDWERAGQEVDAAVIAQSSPSSLPRSARLSDLPHRVRGVSLPGDDHGYAALMDEVYERVAGNHIAKGLSCAQQGRTDAAEAEYERAMEVDPSSAAAHLHLANLWKEQGRAEEAIREYRRAAELRPDWATEEWFRRRLADACREAANVHLAIGIAHLQHAELDAACAEFEAAIELAPGLAGPHLRLADARMKQGRAREAIEGYGSALELQPDWGEEAWLHLRLANAYREAGLSEEATEEYRTVLVLNPDHAAAKRWLEELSP